MIIVWKKMSTADPRHHDDISPREDKSSSISMDFWHHDWPNHLRSENISFQNNYRTTKLWMIRVIPPQFFFYSLFDDEIYETENVASPQ